MKKLLCSVAFLVLGSAPAFAGGSAGSIGVGAESTLLGVGGASVNYDQGDFHVGGFLGFRDGDDSGADTRFELGGRFFWHIHSTAMSDFGVGGQLGIRNENDPTPADDDPTSVFIDLGIQIRAFVTSNVAISPTIGLAIATADSDVVALTGDLVGSVGIHYYFF